MTDSTHLPGEGSVDLTKPKRCPGFGGPPCGAPIEVFAAFCERCEPDVLNAREITFLLGALTGDIDAALKSVAGARVHLGELMSNRVYDVELADATTGWDTEHELEVAARALRHAQRAIAARVALDSSGGAA